MENNVELEEESTKLGPDINTFVLNTNSTCFLCLNDNISDDQLSSELEQKGTTLISICRYLKVDFNDLIRNKSNFSVALCGQCSTLTEKLSNLCREWEVLQMKINHSLKAFQDELEDSEMDIVRVEKFQDGRLQEDEVHLVEILRKKIKKQCDLKLIDLNSLLPKVIITDDPKIPSMNAPPTTPTPTSPAILSSQSFQHQNQAPPISRQGPPSIPEDVPNLPTPILVEVPVPTPTPELDEVPVPTPTPELDEVPVPTPTPELDEVPVPTPTPELDEVPSPPPDSTEVPATDTVSVAVDVSNVKSRYKTPSKRSKLHICTLCQPPLSMSSFIVQKHQVLRHVDMLMTDSKLPTISPEDFKIYANHIFKIEAISSRKAINPNNGTTICCCPYCSVTYSTHEYVKVHLYNSHKEILSKKLIELQETSTIDQIKSTDLPPLSLLSSSGQTIKCDACGTPFTLKSSLKKHKNHYCKFGPRLPVLVAEQKRERKPRKRKQNLVPNMPSNSKISHQIQKMETEAEGHREDIAGQGRPQNMELEDEGSYQVTTPAVDVEHLQVEIDQNGLILKLARPQKDNENIIAQVDPLQI